MGVPHANAGAGDRRRVLDQRFGSRGAAPGEIRRLRITEAHDYDVIGELIDEAPLSPASQPETFRILASA